MWQDLHVELAPEGLTVLTVAFDNDPEDARPWIERANPTHPSLIDTNYVLADHGPHPIIDGPIQAENAVGHDGRAGDEHHRGQDDSYRLERGEVHRQWRSLLGGLNLGGQRATDIVGWSG